MICLNLGNNVEVLMSGNVRCYNIVVEAMKAFPVSEKIQEVSCCLLHRLTLGELHNSWLVHYHSIVDVSVYSICMVYVDGYVAY